ncbi:MAG TPA: hypothetical protein VLE96_03995, partial [Chlamydiales bacterium]|nr:hypothetical protein [Chlamydiales bacterium]
NLVPDAALSMESDKPLTEAEIEEMLFRCGNPLEDEINSILGEKSSLLEFSYLRSCEYNLLSNSQKLELPRIILERISSTNGCLSDEEMSHFFPENTLVQFTGNDEFKLIFKEDDTHFFPHYQIPEHLILQKNLMIIANILEQIIYVSEIKNEKLDELINAMKHSNSVDRRSEFLSDLKRIQANFETTHEYFLDLCPQLKLSEKLELPIVVLERVQSSVHGLTKEQLLEMIPENTLAEKKDKLVLKFNTRIEKIPQKYCAPEGNQGNGSYWKKSNVYSVGMFLKTILNEEIDPKLNELITLMTLPLSSKRPRVRTVLDQLKLIQATLRIQGN